MKHVAGTAVFESLSASYVYLTVDAHRAHAKRNFSTLICNQTQFVENDLSKFELTKAV